MTQLYATYQSKKKEIDARLSQFKQLSQKEYFNEFLYCLLTPASNAQRCWKAVQELATLKTWNQNAIAQILVKYTRFHNRKAARVVQAPSVFKEVLPHLNQSNKLELRNMIAKNVDGYGLKEASHFLRNIGKSDNQVAILDRHILKHLALHKVIQTQEIKTQKHYLEIEQQFIKFAQKQNIPLDHLDLVFWSAENGEVFK